MSNQDLKPCPFCGGTNMRIDDTTHWTGIKAELLFVTIRHWCGDRGNHPGGNHPGSTIEIRRKTQAEAVEAWNRRASPWLPMDSAPEHDLFVCRFAVGVSICWRGSDGAIFDESGHVDNGAAIAWAPIPPLETVATISGEMSGNPQKTTEANAK